MRHLGRRQMRRYAAKTSTDRFYVKMEYLHERRRNDDRNNRARNAVRNPGPYGNNRDRKKTYAQRGWVERLRMHRKSFPLRDEIGGNAIEVQPQQITHFRRENDKRNAACEADSDGIWDELQQLPETENAHKNEQYSRKHRRYRKPVVPILLNNAVNDDDERAGRSSDLHTASAE